MNVLRSAVRFPLRKVTRREYYSNKYCRHGEGRIEHTLECGHAVLEKQSAGSPSASVARNAWCSNEQQD